MTTADENRTLLDLRERLSEKGEMLWRLASAASSAHERFRLYGKCEGVRLALSVVDECVRQVGGPDGR